MEFCRGQHFLRTLVLAAFCVLGGFALAPLKASSPDEPHRLSEPNQPDEKNQQEQPAEAPPKQLFAGKDLAGWEVVEQHVFDRHGKVFVDQESIVLEAGNPATGVRWKGPLPRTNYELRLEAKRIDGSDFFCGLTFPVGDEYCTFIVGGWGGGTTGLSNIDDLAAIENETTDYIQFQQDKWYAIRLRVTDDAITAWIDGKQMLHVTRTDKKFSIWWEQEPLRPLGISTWYTHAAIRKVELVPAK